MADIKKRPEDEEEDLLNPSDPEAGKQLLSDIGDAVTYIPRKFVEGGIDFGRRFVEGGKMAMGLNAQGTYSDAKPAPAQAPAKPARVTDPSADPFPAAAGDDAKTLELKKKATEYYNQSTQPAEPLPTVKLAAARKSLAAKKGIATPAVAAPEAPAPSGPASELYDPTADLEKRNLQDRADLAAAQSASRKNADAALAHSYAEQALHAGTGVAVDQNSINLKNAEISRPLDELSQRRKVEQENQAAVKQQFEMRQEMRQDDPNDPMARQAAALAVKQGMMPASAANGFTLRQWAYMTKGADFQQAKAKADEDARHNRADEYLKARGQNMQLQEAMIRAQNAGQPKAMHMDKAASKNLQTIDTLEAEIRKMPTTWDPRNMYVWSKRINDLGATMVGAGRLNQVLMANIKQFSPEWWNTPGRAKELQNTLLDMVHESRNSILDQQEAAGVDPNVMANHRALYDQKYGRPAAGSASGVPDMVDPRTGRTMTWNGQTWVPRG